MSLLGTLALGSLASARRCGAQAAGDRSAATDARPVRSWWEVVSGGALEEYLRALQLDTARSRPYPQSVRGFGEGEVERMRRAGAVHPWSDRIAAPTAGRVVAAALLRPGLRLVANTGFPFGMNDGALWAGRGVAGSVDVGGVLRAGPVTVRLQPVLVWAQNAAFPLADERLGGQARFRSPVAPEAIDLPQRFGATPFGRLDLGESEVRLDAFGLTAGVSNASQTWGPATVHPLILGANAPGFVHSFVGTGRPLPVGLGRLHARLVGGRLEQSEYSPAADSLRQRIGAGIVVAFVPRWPRGLEVGATRFQHRRWASGALPFRVLRVPLEGLALKQSNLAVDDPESPNFLAENQLASAFARWAPAGGRAELYGEYGREDAALDVRDLIVEPDHESSYTLGARVLLASTDARLRLLRVERMNGRNTQLDRVRAQGVRYTHSQLVQGHTNRGKVLGSVAVFGGDGLVIGLDDYDAAGVTRFELHRIVRLPSGVEGAASPGAVDVQYAARAERTRFRGGSDVTGSVGAVWELNRNFGHDAFNVNVSIGIRPGGRNRPTMRGATPG